MFWNEKKPLPRVTFATNCWERDWRHILLDPLYLSQKQIANHLFPFEEKLLVINNMSDLSAVCQAAQKKVDEGVLSRYVVADEIAEELLEFFQLKREDFCPGPDADQYHNVNMDWIYYNAIGPLAAIYLCQSDYLLYLTGDVRLDEPVEWIDQAIRVMEKKSQFKVANLTWFYRYDEVKRESQSKKRNFFVSNRGFSDTMFLVRRSDFRAPIFREIRDDVSHFPRGDTFEKRAFSAMKNRGWLRLTYSKGSYVHEHV
jgi:hypothetical protein